jgi:hypothetical protein
VVAVVVDIVAEAAVAVAAGIVAVEAAAVVADIVAVAEIEDQAGQETDVIKFSSKIYSHIIASVIRSFLFFNLAIAKINILLIAQ